MDEAKKKYFEYDYLLLVPTLLLVGLGLVAIYSASSFLAEHRMGDSYYFLKRQGMFCLVGLCFMIFTKNIPSTIYPRLVYPLLGISLFLLMLLLVPGVGTKVGGASRWFRIAGFSFQPSELAKLALAFYVAYSIAKKGPAMSSFSNGLVPHLLIAGAFMGLILLQPDLGTTIIIGCWLVIVLFVGGVNLLHLVA